MTRIAGLRETPEGRLRRVLSGDIRSDTDVKILQEHVIRERDKIKAMWDENELRKRAGVSPATADTQEVEYTRFIRPGGIRSYG